MSAGSMLIVEASSSSSAVTISKCVAVNGGLNITLSKEKEAQLLADKYLNVSVRIYSSSLSRSGGSCPPSLSLFQFPFTQQYLQS